MSKWIFIILLLLFVKSSFGQEKAITRDLLLFEQAAALQELADEELDLNKTIKYASKEKAEYASEIEDIISYKALKLYKELIDSFPKSRFFFRALNNKGFIELDLEDTASARTTFLRILNSNANDKEKGGIGSGLMGEPYANYKYRAAKTLTKISIDEKNWLEALRFLDSTKKYPYRHFCGNEAIDERNYRTQLYSQCYIELKQYKNAYDILLPNILENAVSDNTELIRMAYNSLLKSYSKQELGKKFELAFKNIKEEIIKEDKYYYIIFLGKKINLSSFEMFSATNEKERTQAISNIYKNSQFRKLLSGKES